MLKFEVREYSDVISALREVLQLLEVGRPFVGRVV